MEMPFAESAASHSASDADDVNADACCRRLRDGGETGRQQRDDGEVRRAENGRVK